MKNILIISQYFTPDITAAAFRIKDLYDVIRNSKQLNVDIITTYPHKSETNDILKMEEGIYRIDINRSFRNKFFNYLYQYFSFSYKAYGLSHQIKNKYDVVFVTSPPIFTLIPAYLISRKHHAKFIIDIRDIWPDSAVDAGMLSRGSILYKVAKKIELFMYKNADIITCVSKMMCSYISQYAESNKIKPLYNGVSEKDIKSIGNAKQRQIDSNHKKLRLFYAGNIGRAQKLDVLIKAFMMDATLRDKYEIHIIGGGAFKEELLSKAENNNISIKYYGGSPKEETINILCQNADVLFLSLTKKESFKKTIPSKLFDYLLINKPIVYGIEGEGKEMLDKLQCGEYFDVDYEKNLIKALDKMNKKYADYLMRSQGNFEYVINNFNRSDSFKSFIKSV